MEGDDFFALKEAMELWERSVTVSKDHETVEGGFESDVFG